MYAGDRSRKQVLVEHGFRLPSALDNRPLTYDEFDDHVEQVDLRFGDAGNVRNRAQRAGRRDDHPSDRAGRSGSRGAADAQSGRRLDGRDPPARRRARSACW